MATLKNANSAAAPTCCQSRVGLRSPSSSSCSSSAGPITWPSRKTVSPFSTVTWTGATASSASLRKRAVASLFGTTLAVTKRAARSTARLRSVSMSWSLARTGSSRSVSDTARESYSLALSASQSSRCASLETMYQRGSSSEASQLTDGS